MLRTLGKAFLRRQQQHYHYVHATTPIVATSTDSLAALFKNGCSVRSPGASSPSLASPPQVANFSTTTATSDEGLVHDDYQTELSLDDMPFLHHGKRPRYRNYRKFESPRKRANKLMEAITQEQITKSKESKPNVWETPFRVGDAIEIKLVAQGGVNSNRTEKIRGVVLAIYRKKLDTSVLIRDVIFGHPVERRIPLYSPLLRSIKVLEENFVFKGKRKVKRAKLYYLSDRNPLLTRVTKG